MKSIKRVAYIISIALATSGAQAADLLNDPLNKQAVFSHTYTTTGDGALVSGNTTTLGDSTLGASTMVGGYLDSAGAVTIGANAEVDGTVYYGTALVVSASATTGGSSLNATQPLATHLGVTAAQDALNALGDSNELATGNIATDTTFTPGVYNVTGLLSTTAGITLTLDAQNRPNADFIFNVSNYLSFGAGTIIDVINTVDDNTSVVWNTPGGYTSVGANAKIVGTILANTYVSTGAYSTLTGSGNSCGGVFSATSYVTVGANATVGGKECEGAINICLDDNGDNVDIVDCDTQGSTPPLGSGPTPPAQPPGEQ